MAVADPVLQRDAPLPARLTRDDAGQRHQRIDRRTRHRDRAVALQPFRPVLEPGLELLLDQQAAEAGAVDEQVAGDARAVGEQDRGDVAVLLVALDRDDLAFLPHHAARFGEAWRRGSRRNDRRKASAAGRCPARAERARSGCRRWRSCGGCSGRAPWRCRACARAASNDGRARRRARCRQARRRGHRLRPSGPTRRRRCRACRCRPPRRGTQAPRSPASH